MRILLAEDEPDLGAAIKRSLMQAAYVVDWVQDGTEAGQYLDNHWTEYSVAIFDWLLPGQSGIALCRQLRAKQNPLPILMLTAKDSIEDRVAGLDAGADDYLVKPFGIDELLARLRALQRRSPQLHPQKLQVGRLSLDYQTRQLTIIHAPKTDGPKKYVPKTDAPKSSALQPMLELTQKEFQLLEYFMRHANQIVTRDQVLNQLWEIGAEPSSNVVAAQIRLLRRKLAPYNCDLLIETIYGMGYRFNGSLDG
jgi:DNA-binding response OmpR family regulator